jgi:hypothetical protein
MKKPFLFLTATLFLLCGCDIHNTNYDIIKQGVEMYTSDITLIDSNRDWQISGVEGEPGFYIYQQFEIDAITPDVFEDGAVIVYFYETDQRGNMAVKHALPYVYSRDLQDGHGGYYQIMQNIRYEIEPGLLTIVVEWEDYKRCDLSDMNFRVCILAPGANERIR